MVRIACLLVALVSCVVSPSFAQSSSATKPESRAAKPVAVVNLNTASVAELEGLPGIGGKTAARIVDYRKTKGPFKKIEELMNVQGVGEKSFLRIRSQLTVTATSAPTAGEQ